MNKRVEHLVVDTNAFISNVNIQDIGQNVYTIQEVLDEVTCKKQLRHLSVLAYDLVVKDVFTENIKFVTEFSKKTGDYPSLSAIDIKVIALTYQLEKEKVGTEHLNSEPKVQRGNIHDLKSRERTQVNGFFQIVGKDKVDEESKDADPETNAVEEDNESNASDEDIALNLNDLKIDNNASDLLVPVKEDDDNPHDNDDTSDDGSEDSEDDDSNWITVNNIAQIKKNSDDSFTIDDKASVACITADFAMQNVLKQIGLNVSAYDGRLVRQVRTFILRCTTCFKTTSVITKHFCPNCGHASLKKVSVTLDEEGKQHIYINTRRPLTARGKRFTLPAPKGGHHSQNPILNPDQMSARQKPTKLARQKNNPLNDDYIAGYSPFIMRDVNSKSAVLGIRSNTEVKNWMRKNPNEVRKKRK